jgi:hypothetical protein
LTGEYGGDVDSLAMQAEPPACGDEKIKIAQRIGEFGQAHKPFTAASRPLPGGYGGLIL